MTLITGGHTAPRDGRYKLPIGKFITIEGRHHFEVELKAGEKFPGDEDLTFDCHELRGGEVVPKDGVYSHMPTGKVAAFKEGDRFPEVEGGDYVWTRDIDPNWGKGK